MWKLAPVLLEAAAARQQNSSGTTGNPIIFYDNRRNPYHFPQLHQHPQSLPPGYQSSPLTQCIWTFFWLAVLIMFSYPIGIFACQLYIIFSPISAFCPYFSKFTEFLLRVSHIPLGTAQNIYHAKPLIVM